MFQDEPDVDDGVEGQRRDVSSTPASGAVKKILVKKGQKIDGDDLMLEIEWATFQSLVVFNLKG